MESQEEYYEVTCHYGSKNIRKVLLKKNHIYKVMPMNPLKSKMRGEKVKVIGWEGQNCDVLRLDSDWHVKRNIYTKINPCDLVSLEPNQ